MAIQTPHNVDNYLVGGATIWYKLDGATNYQDIGNVTNVQISYDKDELKHFISRSGVRELDRTILTRQEISIAFNVEELNAMKTLKLLLNAGTISNSTQGAQTSSSDTLTAELDSWQELDYQKLSAVVVAVGSSTKTLNTDYEVDTDLGLIKFLSTGSIADSASVTVTYDAEAMTTTERQTMNPLATKSVTELDGVILKIKDGEGNYHELRSSSATLSSTGPMSLSDTDWSNAPFTINILSSATTTYRVYKAS